MSTLDHPNGSTNPKTNGNQKEQGCKNMEISEIFPNQADLRALHSIMPYENGHYSDGGLSQTFTK